jgi:hypothetical protein
MSFSPEDDEYGLQVVYGSAADAFEEDDYSQPEVGVSR